MQSIALMYHDVVEGCAHGTSGFPGRDALLYKLEPSQFAAHLSAVSGAVQEPPDRVVEMLAAPRSRRSVLLTFDDGGVSAYTHIATALEERGWRGHFFITTGRIGTRAFLDREQIRDLYRRGHVIGAHSFSHPQRMGRCRWEELLREWQTSTDNLSAIVGEPIRVASVPGGDYARRIAKTASLAGIKVLFTSQPTVQCWQVDECMVYGRYTIHRWTRPETAAGLAAGKWIPCLKQKLWWNTKGVAKVLGGKHYAKLKTACAGQE